MPVCEIDPRVDRRWTEFLRTAKGATVFHSAPWLEVIQRTYGWCCRVLASLDEHGVVKGGIPYFTTNSVITGRRIVSVPFSDYCHPVCETNSELTFLLRGLVEAAAVHGAGSVEVRGLGNDEVAKCEGWEPRGRFLSHKLSLIAGIEEVERHYHKDCVHRKVRKAVQQGLAIESGTRSKIIDEFYALLVRTRRRHGYPPPPRRWLANLVECVPGGDCMICSYRGTPVAGIFILRWNDTVYYKYGASDERFHRLGPMPFLYREMIRRAAEEGSRAVDLGRTELSNRGLAEFKQRFGGVPTMLQYWEYGKRSRREGRLSGVVGTLGRIVMTRMPLSLLPSIGNALYPHIG